MWIGATPETRSGKLFDKDYLDKIYNDMALLPPDKRSVVFEVMKESLILASDTILIIGKPCFNPASAKLIKNKRDLAVFHIRSLTETYKDYHRENYERDLITCGNRSFSVPMLSRTYEVSSHEDLPYFSFTRRHFFRRFSK